MSMTRCPVLLFTPQIVAWLALFGQTHCVDVLPSGALRWVRQALPVSGGLNDQPALDMEVGDWIATVMGRLTRESSEQRRQRLQIRGDRRGAADARRAGREDMGSVHG